MSEFEYQLVYHSSPTLAGLKHAALFSFPAEHLPQYRKEIAAYNTLMADQGLHIYYLYCCSQRIFVYVCQKDQLLTYLKQKKISDFLLTQGYPDLQSASLNQILIHLRTRIRHTKEFPHEIGFFLGYPVHDVLEFIRHKGKNYKLCGYWKVYTAEAAAEKTFQTYKRCRRFFLQKTAAGIPLKKLIASSN